LLQIGYQVFHIFYTYAETDERIDETVADTFFAGDGRMSHAGRMADEGFYPTE
jgi:hypothetical protein